MTNQTRILLAQVRTGLALLLDEVERRYGEVVEFPDDHYWTVERSSAFRFDTADRPEITVGQLTDDVASLQELLDAAYDRPIVIWHDLAHLVGILAAVAAMDAPDAPRPQHPTGPFPACG